MNRFARIGLACLIAFTFASPALGSDLQSTDTLDQRLDQGRATATLLNGSNPSPDAASERAAACATATVVHNTRTCRFKPDPDAVGEHSVFRSGTDGRINGYQTYEYGYGGRLIPTKRFRGTGQDHGGFNPPYVMDPRSPGARPSVPREPFPWELPFGY